MARLKNFWLSLVSVTKKFINFIFFSTIFKWLLKEIFKENVSIVLSRFFTRHVLRH